MAKPPGAATTLFVVSLGLLVLSMAPSGGHLGATPQLNVAAQVNVLVDQVAINVPPTSTASLAMTGATALIGFLRDAEWDKRFNKIEAQLSHVSQMLGQVLARLDRIEQSLVQLEEQISALATKIDRTAALTFIQAFNARVQNMVRDIRDPRRRQVVLTERNQLNVETQQFLANPNYHNPESFHAVYGAFGTYRQVSRVLDGNDAATRQAASAYLGYFESITREPDQEADVTRPIGDTDSFPLRARKFVALAAKSAGASQSITQPSQLCGNLADYKFTLTFGRGDFARELFVEHLGPPYSVIFEPINWRNPGGWMLHAGYWWRVYSYVTLSDGGYRVVRPFYYPDRAGDCHLGSTASGWKGFPGERRGIPKSNANDGDTVDIDTFSRSMLPVRAIAINPDGSFQVGEHLQAHLQAVEGDVRKSNELLRAAADQLMANSVALKMAEDIRGFVPTK